MRARRPRRTGRAALAGLAGLAALAGRKLSLAVPVNRRLARKNIRTGLIVGAVCMFMFGITFVVAAAYIS